LRGRIAIHTYRLSLLPLAAAAIFVSTFVPVAWRPATGWSNDFQPADFALNLFLYVPLGVALARRRLLLVLAAVLTCSVAAEATQMWGYERDASIYDVLSNICGALLGYALWRAFARGGREDPQISVGRLFLGLSLLCAAGVLLLWHPARHFDFLTNWRPSYPLVLGNDGSAEQAWRGRIEQLEIFSHQGESTQLLYKLPMPATLRGDSIRVSRPESERIFAAIRQSRSFTVAARAVPDDFLQGGPAPIVSFSHDHIYRNFDLGQEGERIVFRVRNPLEVIDQDFRIDSNPVATHGPLSLVATYDGAIAKLFIDGSLQGRVNTAAIMCASPEVCDSGVPVGWFVLGGVSALLGLALFPSRTRTSLVLVAAISGTAAVILPRLASLTPAAVLSSPWLQLCAGLGAIAVVAARSMSGSNPPHDISRSAAAS
jgi:hypothetical protein